MLNFPTSPTNGQIYVGPNGVTYTWSTADGAWNAEATGAIGSPGTVIYYASSSAPAGYLKANGASLSTATYASLFAVINYTFGGSGASFNLPDLRGQFIRSWSDNGTTYDIGRPFGQTQADDFKSHNHPYSSNGTKMAGRIDPGVSTNFSGSGIGEVTFAILNQGGVETRPRNIALLACIKY